MKEETIKDILEICPSEVNWQLYEDYQKRHRWKLVWSIRSKLLDLISYRKGTN